MSSPDNFAKIPRFFNLPTKKKKKKKNYHVTFEPFPPVIPTSFAELTRFNGRRMINDDPSDYHGRAEEDTAARTGRRTFLSSDFRVGACHWQGRFNIIENQWDARAILRIDARSCSSLFAPGHNDFASCRVSTRTNEMPTADQNGR